MKYLVVLLSLSILSVNAKLTVNEETIHYTVTPSSPETMMREITEAFPLNKSGGSYQGYTKYKINWNFRTSQKRHSCRVTKVKTKLKLEFTMPKLESDDPEVKKAWDRWFPDLQSYLEGQGEIAKDYAAKIDEGIKNLKPRGDCKVLQNEANKIGQKFLEDLNEQLFVYKESSDKFR
ncbi:MAG: DUF922 domain-containing protein [Gammaproteobacteria bacterium]|nr:DUF922 domain-containing protein [Gammaproteobacteria bacterium]